MGCAILGLVVAGLIVLYVDLSAEFDASLYTGFAILCPPSLLSIPFSEAMKNKGGFYGVWSLIGLVNAGLYAVIGAGVARLLWKSD